jgi:hypothetical protein
MRSPSSEPKCDIEHVLELHGCRKAYERLEECLGEHDRDWSACQEPLRLLRDCYEAHRLQTNERDPHLADQEKNSRMSHI